MKDSNNKEEEFKKLFNSLSIIKGHIEGKVPFKVDNIDKDLASFPFAILSINGDKYRAWMDGGNKLWINDFPINNSPDERNKGFLGFPTEVSYVIYKNYEENKNKKKEFDNLGFGNLSIAKMGLNELRKIVSEEVSKVLREGDYNYAREEVEYVDFQNLEKEEAEISSALSFIQDIQSSVNKLKNQGNLVSTNPETDTHIQDAINHMNKAIDSYLDDLLPNIKSQVIGRIGEVNIEV